MIDLHKAPFDPRPFRGKDNSQIQRMNGSGMESPIRLYFTGLAPLVGRENVISHGIDVPNGGSPFFGLDNTDALDSLTTGDSLYDLEAHRTHIQTLAALVRYRICIGGVDTWPPDTFNRSGCIFNKTHPTILIFIKGCEQLREAFEQGDPESNTSLNDLNLLIHAPLFTNVFVRFC